MRNNYETYVLVRLKDGRQYVCAMNRRVAPKRDNDTEAAQKQQQELFLKQQVWH